MQFACTFCQPSATISREDSGVSNCARAPLFWREMANAIVKILKIEFLVMLVK